MKQVCQCDADIGRVKEHGDGSCKVVGHIERAKDRYYQGYVDSN